MDFLKFINSNAIRNHLKEINYKFTADEAAFIVWQSAYCSMAEKHEAWKYIIDNTPDEEVVGPATTWVFRDSLKKEFKELSGLHEYLQTYIGTERRLVDLAMVNEDKTVFSFARYYENDPCIIEDNRLFTSFDKLMKAVDEEIKDMSGYELKWIFIKKTWLDTDEKYIQLRLNPDKSIFDIGGDTGVRTELESNLWDLFDCMWFAIPTPFEKGDILYSRTPDGSYPVFEVPFVLNHICYWDINDIGDARKRHAWGSMDMTAYGYFLNGNGEVFYECTHDYFSLDYCPEKLEGKQKILTALSNYLKGEISVDLLMNAYHIILNEENIATQRKYLGMTDEGLRLAGLKEELT